MTQENLLQLSAVILLLPLCSFVINIFLGKRLKRVSGWLGTFILGIALVLSGIVAFTKLVTYDSTPLLQMKADWFTISKDIVIRIGIGIDNLSAIMLIVVSLISFLVHLFSTEYMKDDIRYSRYFAYLGLFTFSMLGIVIANNFLFMYTFWELVGISSYLLIGFWYEKDSAANAGKKAFIVNRIGDLGFLVGILIVFMTYGTFFYDEVFSGLNSGILPFDSGTSLTIAGILIFCGAIGKSAQFPLHIWLPDAMEGPTPVSALIHAATMVAAGVYLVARVFPMLTADALTVIAYIGAITAFISATIALTQRDFKKVLAYSTVSQLGYMIMALGVGAYTNGFFHLVTHAWFKAALFLASGSVIYAMHNAMHKLGDHHSDAQDIYNMGGLRKTMPKTYFTFLMATIAISGVPLTSGFLSKDGILAGTLAYANLSGNWLIPILGFGSAGLTAFYMFRLTILAFHGKPKTEIATHTHENRFSIVFPLVVLAILSFWFFYSPNPIDASKGWFHQAIKQPVTAVPDQYQWNFLVHYSKHQECNHKDCNHDENHKCSHEKEMQQIHPARNDDSIADSMQNHIKTHEGELQLNTQNAIDMQQHSGTMAKLHKKKDKNIAKDKKQESKVQYIDFVVAENDSIKTAHSTECCHDSSHNAAVGCATTGSHGDNMASAEHSGAEGSTHEYANKFEEEIHHMHLPAMILSLLIAGCGILFSFMMYQFKLFSADKMELQFKVLHNFSFRKWYFDEVYQATFVNGTIGLAKLSALFDNYVVDGIVNLSAGLGRVSGYFAGYFDNYVVDGIVNLLAKITGLFGIILRKFQTGSIQTYIIFAIIGIMLFFYFIF